jgi:hypothetical protein
VAVTFNVRGRDLGTTVEEAIKKIGEKVKLPPGYTIGWSGEYESEKRAEARLAIVVPLTVLVIFIILYTMFRSYKWALLILLNVGLARVGGFLALVITGTYLSVSSGVGMLALFGVSVQTGVIMVEYINQRRARGHSIEDSAVEGAVLRLRPIMMTMLVATLGLLPAALSHDIGSDSQRPFAIVIVGGLISDLLLSIVLLPTFYVWIARDGDQLPAPEVCKGLMKSVSPLKHILVAAKGVFGWCLLLANRRSRSRRLSPSRWIKPSDGAQHNHTLQAARTTIQQNQAAEVTANLRPNPTFFTDWEYLPMFHPPARHVAWRTTSRPRPKATWG